jgi:hypothetical protein
LPERRFHCAAANNKGKKRAGFIVVAMSADDACTPESPDHRLRRTMRRLAATADLVSAVHAASRWDDARSIADAPGERIARRRLRLEQPTGIMAPAGWIGLRPAG